MQLNRILLAFAAAVTLLVPARAQESGFRRFIDRIAGPSPELDPEAIYRPKPRFHFALTGDVRRWLDRRQGGHVRPVRAVYRRFAAGNALLEIESY